jgi:hypothetical protein
MGRESALAVTADAGGSTRPKVPLSGTKSSPYSSHSRRAVSFNKSISLGRLQGAHRCKWISAVCGMEFIASRHQWRSLLSQGRGS